MPSNSGSIRRRRLNARGLATKSRSRPPRTHKDEADPEYVSGLRLRASVRSARTHSGGDTRRYDGALRVSILQCDGDRSHDAVMAHSARWIGRDPEDAESSEVRRYPRITSTAPARDEGYDGMTLRTTATVASIRDECRATLWRDPTRRPTIDSIHDRSPCASKQNPGA